MTDQTVQLPDYINDLYAHSDQAIKHLLPDAVIEPGQDDSHPGMAYHDQIQLNLYNLRWFDYQTNKGGELHDLWAYLKDQTPEEAERDIKRFLLNVNTPHNMQRFAFSPEEMNDPGGLYGDWIEVFPGVKLYAGTTTLLAGYNGSGKSTLTTQIAHICAGHGVRSFILSPEMPPEVMGRIVHRQATPVANPTPAEWQRAARHVKNHFLFSTIEDRITPDVAISQFDEAYALGCRLMVLDSLTCVRTGHELYQQADFADMLRNWSRNHPDCFVLVVAHMRKPSGYVGGHLSRYDIRGAGEISDLAGHIWLMQRKNPFSQKEMADYGDYDAKLIVDKNRATGTLTCKMLRFSNLQKLYHPTKQPPCYIDYMYENGNVERIY